MMPPGPPNVAVLALLNGMVHLHGATVELGLALLAGCLLLSACSEGGARSDAANVFVPKDAASQKVLGAARAQAQAALVHFQSGPQAVTPRFNMDWLRPMRKKLKLLLGSMTAWQGTSSAAEIETGEKRAVPANASSITVARQ